MRYFVMPGIDLVIALMLEYESIKIPSMVSCSIGRIRPLFPFAASEIFFLVSSETTRFDICLRIKSLNFSDFGVPVQ